MTEKDIIEKVVREVLEKDGPEGKDVTADIPSASRGLFGRHVHW